MAILDEMQLLVSDLEAAFARRIDGEHERQETAAKDAQHRAMDFRELQAAAAEDARERLDEISRRCSEVADMMDTFFRTRTAQAARDARDRVMAERDRRAEAMVEMRARVSELAEFSGMWGQHTVVMGGLGAEAAQMPAPRAAQRPRRQAPAGAAKPAARKAVKPAARKAAKPAARKAAKPAAPKAAVSGNAET